MLRIRRTLIQNPHTGKMRRLNSVALTFRCHSTQTGPRLALKLDTGTDVTTIPIGHAAGFQLDAQRIRQLGTKITLRVANGQTMDAYLYPVAVTLNDDFGGWAEWNARVAFYDAAGSSQLAGDGGFLEHFNLRLHGEFLDLEPIPNHDAQVDLRWWCAVKDDARAQGTTMP